MALCVGYDFTLFTTSSGTILGYGNNIFGPAAHIVEHEHAHVLDAYTVALDGDDGGTLDSQPVMMTASTMSWACVTRDGAVWTLGPAFGIHQTPMRLDKQTFGLSRALMMACGETFAMLLTESGQVWTCGRNTRGELGHGSYDDCLAMTQINPQSFHGEHITFIATGVEHSMALSAGGSHLWTWGDNRWHLGVLSRDIHSPVGGPPGIFAVPGLVAANTFNGVPVRSMAGSWRSTIVVTEDGSMWGSGCNFLGQLGFEDPDNRLLFERVAGAEIFGEGGVRMVSCQLHSTTILSQLGQIWTCGEHYERIPTLLPHTTDFDNAGVVCIGSGNEYSAIVREDGSHYMLAAWADALMIVPMPMPDVMDEIIGRWHHMPQDEQHRAMAFAQGNHPRLGYESDYRMAPVEALEMVWQFLRFRPSPHAGTGLRNLMGFGPR